MQSDIEEHIQVVRLSKVIGSFVDYMEYALVPGRRTEKALSGSLKSEHALCSH